jgi:hypothetical protein
LAEEPSGGSVNLTPFRALVVAAVFGGLSGWLVVVIAYATHQRIQVRRERIEPQRAVALLVLGKASALAGALVAGGYFGFALMFLTRLDAAAPRDRVIRSAVAILAGVALCIMGLLLERACKVPTEPDEGAEADEGDGLEADTHD